jgi:hypothetical protein
MSKMFWQANPSEKGVYSLFLRDAVLAEFASVNQKFGIGKITEAAVKHNEVYVFKWQDSAILIYNAETGQPVAEIKLDVSRNGKIEFSSAEKYVWEQTAWTSFDRAWKNADGENPAVFELNNRQIAENFVSLKMSENAGKVGRIFLLILLGWALIVKEKARNGASLLAEGNPQEFLAEDKIKEIFGIDFKAENFNRDFVAATAMASVAAVDTSNSGLDLEDAADAVGVGFDLLDWF